MFNKFSTYITKAAGSPYGFAFALIIVVGWGVSGRFYHYSEAWSLFINTLTTIITFLMVFIIQHSQNKDTCALHLKIDELVKANADARNELIGIESKSVDEIKELKN